ncbi:MAG: hypothetical protein US97_C0027G0004 [Microgenomates group bacterium GW2011_GWF1_38_5]|nr:MAG: hypothetical protein US97_C0027G0004 [Microgenomates group bacterium GW2011_GWF1_38_5]
MLHSKKKGSPLTLNHLLFLLLIVLFFGIITVYNYSKTNRGSGQFNSQISTPTSQNDQDKLVEIQIGDRTVTAELANTDSLRQKGLSFRENLEADSGMLFIFEKPQTPFFWMKDMNFPLDIIWINENTIIDIDENVPFPEKNTPLNQLPKYTPKEQINYVLEINAGYTDKYGIEAGDVVIINF